MTDEPNKTLLASGAPHSLMEQVDMVNRAGIVSPPGVKPWGQSAANLEPSGRIEPSLSPPKPVTPEPVFKDPEPTRDWLAAPHNFCPCCGKPLQPVGNVGLKPPMPDPPAQAPKPTPSAAADTTAQSQEIDLITQVRRKLNRVAQEFGIPYIEVLEFFVSHLKGL